MKLRKLATVVIQHRIPVAIAMCAITAIALWGHLRGGPPKWAEASDEVEAIVEKERRTGEEVLEGFGQSRVDSLLVVEVNNLFSAEVFDAVRDMVAAIEELPQVESVIWIEQLPLLNMFGVPEPILPPRGSDDHRYKESRQRIFEHPLAVGQLISDDGETLLMPLFYDWLHVSRDEDCLDAVLATARNSIRQGEGIDIEVRMTGSVPLFIAQNESLARNKLKFQIVGYGLSLAVATYLFRGLVPVLIVSGAPGLSIFWTMGILNLLNENTNALTNVILPVLISMVGLTDGVHLMMHIRRHRAEGLSSIEAARSAIEHVGLACALTSLTTAIGFGSLTLAHAEFINSFGRACSVGVIVSFVAVVTFIPLMCTTTLAKNIHRGHERDLLGQQMERTVWIVEWIVDHARVVSLAGIFTTVALAVVAFSLRPDSKTKNSLPSDSPISAALTHCDESMGGTENARIAVKWGESTDNHDPRLLDVLAEIEQIVNAEPLLRHPLSIRNMLDTFPKEQMDENDRMVLLDLLPPPLKNAYYSESQRETILTTRVQDLGIATYEPVFRRIEGQFEAIEERYPGYTIELGGDPVRRGRELHQIVMDLVTSLGAASGIILVVLTLVYRSIRIGLISVIPNLFPLTATAGFLVAMGGALDFATVCSFTVCLGIAVDDTIHFLSRFQQELESQGERQMRIYRPSPCPLPCCSAARAGARVHSNLPIAQHDVRQAIRSSYLAIGRALVTTTIILVIGFGTALTSDLPDHRIFAGMACSTIGAALLGDLLLLPAMLTWLWPKRQK